MTTKRGCRNFMFRVRSRSSARSPRAQTLGDRLLADAALGGEGLLAFVAGESVSIRRTSACRGVPSAANLFGEREDRADHARPPGAGSPSRRRTAGLGPCRRGRGPRPRRPGPTPPRGSRRARVPGTDADCDARVDLEVGGAEPARRKSEARSARPGRARSICQPSPRKRVKRASRPGSSAATSPPPRRAPPSPVRAPRARRLSNGSGRRSGRRRSRSRVRPWQAYEA